MDEQNLSNLSLYESFLNESEEIVNEPLASKEDVDKESVIEEEKGLTLYQSFLNESENALPLKQETKELSTSSTPLYNSFLNEELELLLISKHCNSFSKSLIFCVKSIYLFLLSVIVSCFNSLHEESKT